MIVTAFTAASMSGIASASRQRSYLAILNQSEAATIYVAFDTPAVAAATAGQLTIGPINPGVAQAETPGAVFRGIDATPWNSIHIIASAGNTPVTILES